LQEKLATAAKSTKAGFITRKDWKDKGKRC
jgi:hypothetical protein